MNHLVGWSAFGVVVFTMLLLDLGILNRKEKAVSMREALTWSAVWIISALLFCAGIYWVRGQSGDWDRAYDDAVAFLTGYLVEESLSVDNLFVFVLIFSYFRVSPTLQRTVLYWGILGAILMRAVFIAAGIALIQQFHWIIYIFGAFLVYTGVKLAFKGDDEVHPDQNIVLRIFRRFFPVTKEYVGKKFWIRENGKLFATPLFVVVIVVETTDLIFAVDSIPAIIGITQDPFLVYTSNIFAVMGLRSLYFALAGLMDKFHLLKYGLAVILSFVGIKMLVPGITELLMHHEYEIPNPVALGVVIGTLALCMIGSLIIPPPREEAHAEAAEQELQDKAPLPPH
ncbi:MAG TPA: TerC family protein [Planctomycetaceae bacterium]|nr:TerC family protein [Planctomycetaceae bacterium]